MHCLKQFLVYFLRFDEYHQLIFKYGVIYMTDLQEYITSYFGITNQHMDKITALFKPTTLKKGAYFTKTGQYCQKLSFVHAGYLRVYGTYHQKEVTQWIASKGSFITDLYSFNFKQRARFTIQALTDCTLYNINQKDYDLLNTKVPNWQAMEKQFIAGCFVHLEDRIFSHLSQTAEERYNQLFEYDKELFNHVPQHYLASMLGMSPETFSRIRNKKNS